jgi:hypothetical protein
MSGLTGVYVGVSPFGDGEVAVVFADRTGNVSLELIGDTRRAHRLLSDALAAVDAVIDQQDDDIAVCDVCGDMLRLDQMADHTAEMHQP